MLLNEILENSSTPTFYFGGGAVAGDDVYSVHIVRDGGYDSHPDYGGMNVNFYRDGSVTIDGFDSESDEDAVKFKQEIIATAKNSPAKKEIEKFLNGEEPHDIIDMP